MKLIDAIRNVQRPTTASSGECSAPVEAMCSALGIAELWEYTPKLDDRLKAYVIITWLCTDTYVGLRALYLDGEAVGCAVQTARKAPVQIKWLSEDHALRVREVLLSYTETPPIEVVDPDEEIGDDFAVEYVTQPLTEEGFYQGRPVKALVWYDGLMGCTTPEEHRRPGRAYFVAVRSNSPKANCVLVQDRDEHRLIPISEFRMPLKVRRP